MYDPLFRCEAHDLRFVTTAGPSGRIDREWWDGLSRQQQLDYIKEHKNTVYKRLGVKRPGQGPKPGQPTNIEQQQNQKLGNEPGDQQIKKLNHQVDEKLNRINQQPELQRALAANSEHRTRGAKALRDHKGQIIEHFAKKVPPAGVSKTADQLRTLLDLPPETPGQALRNTLAVGGAAVLARIAFMEYAVPAMGLVPGLGLTIGTGVASVILFGTIREMLRRQSQKHNLQRIVKDTNGSQETLSMLLHFVLADELSDAAHLHQMDDHQVIGVFLDHLADTMENQDMPLSYWARAFDLHEEDQTNVE